MLAASVAALRAAAPRRTPLTLRKASAADAIRDALSFAQRASPATADDRLAHSMRARDLTEDELRAVLVGRGVDEAATADVPRGILADLLGELRAADDARSAAKALGTAPSAPRESLLPSLDASPPTLRDVVAPDALRQGLGTAASAAASAAAQIGLGDVVDDATRAAKNVASSALRSDAAAPVRRAATQAAASVAAERPRETARAAWTAVKQKKPLRRLRRLPRAIVRGSSRAAVAGFLEATTGAARGAAAWAGAGVVGPGPVVVVVSVAAILGRGRLVAPLSALVALRIVAGGLAAGEGDDDDDRGGE
jgi:hypothetical protein